jgi:hypothetical protein
MGRRQGRTLWWEGNRPTPTSATLAETYRSSVTLSRTIFLILHLAPHLHDEWAAYGFLESRVWPNGPVCPKRGGIERISKMDGASTRIGTYKCYQCRSQVHAATGKKEKSQRERFIKAAREAGVDESGKTFDKAIQAIILRRRGGD